MHTYAGYKIGNRVADRECNEVQITKVITDNVTCKPITISTQRLLKAICIVRFFIHYHCCACCHIGWVGLELWVFIHRVRLAVGMGTRRQAGNTTKQCNLHISLSASMHAISK